MKTLKAVLFWTVMSFLLFGAGLTLAVLFERRAEAQEKPKGPYAACYEFTGNVAKCEIHGVTEWTPHWETVLDKRIAQHAKGIVTYLTVDEKWRELHIYIITRDRRMELFYGFIRIQEGKVVFGMQEKDD